MLLKFPGVEEDVSTHVQTKNHGSGSLRTQVMQGVSTVLMSQPYSLYPTVGGGNATSELSWAIPPPPYRTFAIRSVPHPAVETRH